MDTRDVTPDPFATPMPSVFALRRDLDDALLRIAALEARFAKPRLAGTIDAHSRGALRMLDSGVLVVGLVDQLGDVVGCSIDDCVAGRWHPITWTLDAVETLRPVTVHGNLCDVHDAFRRQGKLYVRDARLAVSTEAE